MAKGHGSKEPISAVKARGLSLQNLPLVHPVMCGGRSMFDAWSSVFAQRWIHLKAAVVSLPSMPLWLPWEDARHDRMA
jgi:hypothetical protein